MSQFLGFGSSSDGNVTLSGTEAPIDSSAATSGSNIAATNASFAANQLIIIHQTQGPSAGGWEVNQIQSYVAGTITPSVPLANTYSVSGGNHHQVRVIPQYGNITVSGTLTTKAWNGTTGGITFLLGNGTCSISGTVTASGQGFRGGASVGDSGNFQGNSGESSTGTSSASAGNNGMGGGGGGPYAGSAGSAAPGAGGGHGSAGENGTDTGGGYTVQSTGGVTGGTSDLITLLFGGAGGGGGSRNFNSGNTSGTGGNSGGVIIIMANILSISGSVFSNGNQGGNASRDGMGAGGGAAGGAVLIKSSNATIGTNLVMCTGGAVGAIGGNNGAGKSGAGGVGRVRIEACNIADSATYSTNPSASAVIGGFSWCSLYSTMM